MGDLRRRVAEKKARGLYSVDALMTEPASRDEPFEAEELESEQYRQIARGGADATIDQRHLRPLQVCRLLDAGGGRGIDDRADADGIAYALVGKIVLDPLLLQDIGNSAG